jgi:hypothetical protein
MPVKGELSIERRRVLADRQLDRAHELLEDAQQPDAADPVYLLEAAREAIGAALELLTGEPSV